MLNADYTQSIIEHMNDDHSDAVLAYVQAYTEHGNATAARMMSIDAVGMDIEYSVADEAGLVRVEYPEPLTSDDEVRPVLVKMVKRAREMQAGN